MDPFFKKNYSVCLRLSSMKLIFLFMVFIFLIVIIVFNIAKSLFYIFFSVWVFFHEHSPFTGQ